MSPVSRHVTVLQHVPFEGPGAIPAWAASRGHSLTVVALHAGKPVPAAASVDAAVVLGGPMGAGDEGRFRFLRAEKHLLRECVDRGRAVLGICLGAQLLAETLGARVESMGRREIGWYPLRWSPMARGVPPFAHVPAETVVLHWHGDTFSLPPGTIRLASTDGCPEQGFAAPDGRVVGLQFHLEMRAEDVASLVRHGRGDLLSGGAHVQGEREILAGHGRFGAPLGPLLDTLLDGWLAAG